MAATPRDMFLLCVLIYQMRNVEVAMKPPAASIAVNFSAYVILSFSSWSSRSKSAGLSFIKICRLRSLSYVIYFWVRSELYSFSESTLNDSLSRSGLAPASYYGFGVLSVSSFCPLDILKNYQLC
jgi:hypothetical protein